MFVRFDGEGTLAGIRGATLLNDKQHADTTLVADHKAGGCQRCMALGSCTRGRGARMNDRRPV